MLSSKGDFWITKPGYTRAERKTIDRIRTITDTELLKEIYSTAQSRAVRNAALSHIEDQNFLYDLFVANKEDILPMISDDALLRKIANNPDVVTDDRIAAAELCGEFAVADKLRSRIAADRICSFAGKSWWKEFETNILPALTKISSEDILQDIAHRAKSDAAARYAVEHISSAQYLYEIAKDPGVTQQCFTKTVDLFEDASPATLYTPLTEPRYLALMKLKNLSSDLFQEAVKSIVLNKDDTPCFRAYLLANHASSDTLRAVISADDAACGLLIGIPYEQEQYGEYKTESCTLNVDLKEEAMHYLSERRSQS